MKAKFVSISNKKSVDQTKSTEMSWKLLSKKNLCQYFCESHVASNCFSYCDSTKFYSITYQIDLESNPHLFHDQCENLHDHFTWLHFLNQV